MTDQQLDGLFLAGLCFLTLLLLLGLRSLVRGFTDEYSRHLRHLEAKRTWKQMIEKDW
jgi:hypothetical protein